VQYEWWGEPCARAVPMSMLQWGARVASLTVNDSPLALWRTCMIGTTTHRYAPDSGSIVLHVCMCKGMIFVFHKIHSDDLCRRPPLRTTMGHPPTTTHRYAPGSGTIVLHVCMYNCMRYDLT
jgi:hypothetical protein